MIVRPVSSFKPQDPLVITLVDGGQVRVETDAEGVRHITWSEPVSPLLSSVMWGDAGVRWNR